MMLHLQLGLFSVSLFCLTVVFLLLTHTCEGQYQLIGPSQPIVALVGDDIILLRHTEPALDASGMTVEWTRPDLNPRFVHVWRDGGELEGKKHPSYRGRTSLLVNEQRHGDVSLKLADVKLSDEGRYRCFLPGLNQASSVQLVVGVVSSPVIEISNSTRGVLQCESEGWYPEPEASWLDSEGHVLSAGPTETVRGPDGLYTVSSRVTVEKRHRNIFTCRVQQKNINQTRETQIHVPDDFFEVGFSSAAVLSVTVSLTVCILLIVAVVFVLWKRRQKKHKTKLSHEDNKQDEEEKNKSTSDESEHQSLMERGGKAETTAMDRDKGGETSSLRSNTESLTAGKNTEERTQQSSQDTNKIYMGNQEEVKEKKGQRSEEENLGERRLNEKGRNQTENNLQTETSEEQDGGQKQPSEGKGRVKTGIDTFQSHTWEEKPNKLTNETKKLADKKLVSTNLKKFSEQSGESEEKPQTESQRPQGERKRNTDQSTLTVAHGHFTRS